MSDRALARKGVLDGQDVVPRATAPRPKKAKAPKADGKRSLKPPLRAPSASVSRGVAAVLVLASALAVALSVLSFHAGHPHANLIGRAGHALAQAVFAAVGVCAFLVPLPLFSLGASLATPDPTKRHWPRLAALVVLALSGATLAHVIIGIQPGQAYPPGGVVGIVAGGVLEDYFGFWGAGLALCAIAASAIVVTSEGWLVRAGVVVGRAIRAQGLLAGAWVWARLQEAVVAYREGAAQRKIDRVEEAAYLKQVLAEEQAAQEEEDDREEEERDADEAEEMADEADALSAVSDKNRGLAEAHAAGDGAESVSARSKRKVARESPEEDPAWTVPDPLAPNRTAEGSDKAPKKLKPPKDGKPVVSAVPSPAEPSSMGEGSPLPRIVVSGPKGQSAEVPFDEKGEVELLAQSTPEDALKTSLPPQPAKAADAKPGEAKAAATDALPAPSAAATPGSLPAIIERPALPKIPVKKKEAGGFEMAQGHTSFVLPTIESVLEIPEEKKQLRVDKDVFFATAEKLRLKLKDFGIDGEVKEIHPGPVVTMYEFVPGPGIKISKIASLADDLAMAMEALRVRIVAPLPGRGSVGIEVPNKERETVYLKEIIESDRYANTNSKLTMCLGKNIEGMPYVMDLAKAPHLLIAGTTGSGKSVSVNSMIMSLLLKATPEELRFIMVDPKMLELSIYEGIPHLLLPVVTDSKKAALALQWAVDEMQRRYQLMSDAGVRNLAGYNKLIESGGGQAKPAAPKADAKIVVDVAEGHTPAPIDEALDAESEKPEVAKKLPYIVVIIDELADLMMVASREVETSIARLAQMARAAGIHLMVATQRPSTDVVTGIIKANFPTRISFMLRSKPDSMTILGQNGAEALLGMGDMLVQPPTDAHVIRVHGAYVSEVEIKKVVDHLKQQGKPVYDESILKARETEGDGEGGAEEDDLSDELYDQALAIVAEMKEVSISVLQRKMRIGYNRSARMIERMERDGVVASADGTKPRRVLIRPVGEMSGAQA